MIKVVKDLASHAESRESRESQACPATHFSSDHICHALSMTWKDQCGNMESATHMISKSYFLKISSSPGQVMSSLCPLPTNNTKWLLETTALAFLPSKTTQFNQKARL